MAMEGRVTRSMSRRDPADVLGLSLLSHVLSFLEEPEDLCNASKVSSTWRSLGAADDLKLWRPLCERAWAPLVYVGPQAADSALSWKQRYAAVRADQERTDLREEELVAWAWQFR